MNTVHTLQIGLGDLDVAGHDSVHFHIQLVGEVSQVDRLGQIKLRQRLHIRHIEGIGQVLEAHEDLVLAQWEESVTAGVGHTLAELLGELEELLISFLVGDLLLDGALVVECEEVIQWLLNIELLLPLKRRSLARVVDVHVVSGGDADAEAILVGLVDA